MNWRLNPPAGPQPTASAPISRSQWGNYWDGGSLGRGGCESVADDGQRGAAGEAAGGDHGAEVGIDLGAPFRTKPVRHFAKDHRGPQRPLALVVGRFDVTARQEHQQLVTRRDGNGRSQMASLDIGRLEVQQAIQLAVKAAPVLAIVLSARSDRRCLTAQASFKNALNCGAKMGSP